MKFLLSTLLYLFTFLTITAQELQLSPQSKIAILTVGPGTSLNDAFGHSAFRITDSSIGLDLAYGYGEYDFDTPNFYLKFAQGKLHYLLSRHEFSNFYRYYVSRDRTITEQSLNLTLEEKQRLFNFLENNYKPQNRRYLYDFFYDNCATRIRDVAEYALDGTIDYNIPENLELKTFRELIHDHVGINTWGSFGIDLALGSVIDREATAYEHMFLPKYIQKFYDTATTVTGERLVNSTQTIYSRKNNIARGPFFTSPLCVMIIIMILILAVTYNDYKKQKQSKWLDFLIFITTGIIGILILLLWFATDHTATANNYNFLWAFPLNLLVVGQLLKKEPNGWFRKYLKFLVIILVLIAFHWIIGIQIYALASLPLMIALLCRYIYLIKFYKRI